MATLLLRLRAVARRLRRVVLRRRRVLAALCALVAVWAGLRATAAPAPALEPVTVAARDLGAGTVLRAGDLATVGFAPGTVPAGHIRDPVGRQLAGPVRRARWPAGRWSWPCHRRLQRRPRTGCPAGSWCSGSARPTSAPSRRRR